MISLNDCVCVVAIFERLAEKCNHASISDVNMLLGVVQRNLFLRQMRTTHLLQGNESVIPDISVGEFSTEENKVQDMNGMGAICRDESLPPLLRIASTESYPFFSKTPFGEDFGSPGSASQRYSFSDLQKEDWNPPSNYERSWSLQRCGLEGEALRIKTEFPLRPCYSEQTLTEEMRNSAANVKMLRKKVAKGTLSKFSYARNKLPPTLPEVKIEFPNDISVRRDRPKELNCKKARDKRKTEPREKFFSQPNPSKGANHSAMLREFQRHSGPLPGGNGQNSARGSHDSYSYFKTKAPKLERSLSRLCHQEQKGQHGISGNETVPPAAQYEMPVGRYLDALKGPELDILRESESTLLPVDKKWPFLLRFPIGCFGICLGLGSQTILWKTLASAASVHFLHAPTIINVVLWCLALMSLLTVFTTYFLKCFFYFEAVRREFYHPVRINFFFAPWIACMFLALGAPPAVTRSIHPVLWFLFMTPIFALELKIYGQWLQGGERRLSQVANPSTHLSLVGNFVGSLLAATVGLKEIAIFFWAVGLAHYLVLFVTLYQRLPTAAVLPKELHPIFFLFVAAPNTASVAWASIVGDFDFVSRIAYFVGLFLYSSLVVRINFFRGFRFSVSWWAYTFPMTSSAIAAIHYSLKVKHPITQGLAVLLSLISSIAVVSLCLFTILHTFFWCNMFPNDMAIAITNGQFRVKRKIKELDGDVSCSDASPEGVLHAKSRAWHFGKCIGALQVLESLEVSLPTVKSDPFPIIQRQLSRV